MTARREGSRWTVDFCENGQTGRRVCKRGFKSRKAAERYEVDFIALRRLAGCPLDERLSDLVLLWYERRGGFLRNSKRQLSFILGTVKRLGDPRIYDFNAETWTRYVQSRRDKVAPKHLRREWLWLSRVYAELIRYGDWRGENPFAGLGDADTDDPDSMTTPRRGACGRFAGVGTLELDLPSRRCKARAAQFNDSDFTIISGRDAPDAALLSLDSFNSLVETVHLLKSPANATHLARSLAQMESGKTVERELVGDDEQPHKAGTCQICSEEGDYPG
ncbi:type II toxin-antitoxin system Phd/YefM family antitoxin [Pseudomonas sp. CR3202]|uniref:phage integrase n=1 Tax=Pseudomonas sp. CR3202 TaxID=3351532 RepID=UPI003BF35A2E